MGLKYHKRLEVYWVNLSYATYGLEVEDGKVITAPPIASWMIGKNFENEVLPWLKKKKAKTKKLR